MDPRTVVFCCVDVILLVILSFFLGILAIDRAMRARKALKKAREELEKEGMKIQRSRDFVAQGET